MNEHTTIPAMRYLPHVVAATALVAVAPAVAVWWLRAQGAISSPYAGIAVAMGLSLVISCGASACWQRRRGSGDLVFSELLLWGWLGACVPSGGWPARPRCSA